MKCMYCMDNIASANGEYYFVSILDNWIYRIEADGITLSRVMKIPFSNLEAYMEYSKLYYYKNKLFVLPWLAQKIAICDLLTHEVRYIHFKKKCLGLAYLCGVQKNEMLYLVPCEHKDILIINMHSERIEDSINLEHIDNICTEKVTAWGSVAFDDNYIYIPQLKGSGIVRFSFKNRNCDWVKHKSLPLYNGLNGICDTEHGRWYIPTKLDKLYFEDENGIHVFDNFPKKYVRGDDIPFYKIVSLGDSIVLLPMDANMLIKVTETGRFFVLYEITDEQNDVLTRYSYFLNVWIINNICYCIKSKGSTVYTVNGKNELLPMTYIYDRKKESEFCNIENDIMLENPYYGYSLTDYLEFIEKDKV